MSRVFVCGSETCDIINFICRLCQIYEILRAMFCCCCEIIVLGKVDSSSEHAFGFVISKDYCIFTLLQFYKEKDSWRYVCSVYIKSEMSVI